MNLGSDNIKHPVRDKARDDLLSLITRPLLIYSPLIVAAVKNKLVFK